MGEVLVMDRRSWLWRRKSSEKSPGETESSGSSHSERFYDDQVCCLHIALLYCFNLSSLPSNHGEFKEQSIVDYAYLIIITFWYQILLFITDYPFFFFLSTYSSIQFISRKLSKPTLIQVSFAFDFHALRIDNHFSFYNVA